MAAALTVRHARLFLARDRAGFGHRPPRSDRRTSAPGSLATEGPSCLFVGPVETANKEKLEALYQQARDAYYSGEPLIVDDMFDKVELKLRLYGSKSVVKYPRCSLRRQSTYADAEEDPSQVLALASIWILLLAFGISAFVVPTFYTIAWTIEDNLNSRNFFGGGRSSFELLPLVNGILFIGLGSLIGYPVASASVQALRGLWRNGLVALKALCPNCGEEVFAFVKAEKSNLPPHCAECHVCECALEFCTKHSISRTGHRAVYGRVYLVQKTFGKSRRRM